MEEVKRYPEARIEDKGTWKERIFIGSYLIHMGSGSVSWEECKKLEREIVRRWNLVQ